MKKMMTLAACAFVAVAAFGKEQQNKGSVKDNAFNPIVEAVLSLPDGVSLVRNESDGSLQIFARGSASYDFGDARDIRNKTKVAELRAKAALSKYLKEVLEVEESSSEGEGRLSKAVLTQTDDGEVVRKSVTRENIESVKETIKVRSAAILSGVVILKTAKIPTEGGKTAGEIQVTLGISTKTLAAAAEAHNMITDSFNARRDIGEKACNPKEGRVSETEHAKKQKAEVRINDTLF